jgi:hypothetical protein
MGIMLASIESRSGNMAREDQEIVRRAIGVFSDIVTSLGLESGLGRGQNPFARPHNYIAVLDVEHLHIIVDDVPIGGLPYCVYQDERADGQSTSLDGWIEAAVRDLGFRSPFGVSLPASIIDQDEEAQGDALAALAADTCAKLMERLRVEMVEIPEGYRHLRRFIASFLEDNPDIGHNVFIMMRFRDSDQYREIHETLRVVLEGHGLKALRADDRAYTDDLWDNVCIYMFGCTYGIAVFEQIDEPEFNPNVALELGFMLAHSKQCLILKDSRMREMPTDIVGKLYKEFDSYYIPDSIQKCVDRWIVRDLRLSSPAGQSD